MPPRISSTATRWSRRFPPASRPRCSASGCFWGAETQILELPGVYSTAVGYAGGMTPNPTYEEVCQGMTGHTEVVRVVYRPAQVAYDELLQAFWEAHDPTQGMRQGNDVGTQYRSGIYWYDEAQRKAAEAQSRPRMRRSSSRGLRRITTEICRRPSSTTPRTITSSTSRRIPADTAAWVGAELLTNQQVKLRSSCTILDHPRDGG